MLLLFVLSFLLLIVLLLLLLIVLLIVLLMSLLMSFGSGPGSGSSALLCEVVTLRGRGGVFDTAAPPAQAANKDKEQQDPSSQDQKLPSKLRIIPVPSQETETENTI